VDRVQAHLIASAAKADDVARAAAAALGMAVPVALGAASGHLAEGLAVCVGGLVVGGIAPGRDAGEQAREIGATLLPPAAAMAAAIGMAIAGGGFREDAAIVGVAFAAALAGSFSRPAAVGAIRLTLLLLIAATLADGVADRAGLALLVLAGAAWTAAANVVAGAAARRWRRTAPAPTPAPARATFAQRFSRWRRSLAALDGWQYALRLGAGLAVAAVLAALWPAHHLRWIAITVVLLTERKAERWPAKTAQRAIGTLAGVIAAGVLMAVTVPGWALAIGIGALAGARSWLRQRSYLFYTAVTTPLILAILDLGAPPGLDLLADRVVATLAGALLVLAGNRIFPSR
jgi:hypothetical protein